MTARDLIAVLPRVTASGPPDAVITALTDSSRAVEPGALFAAIRGATADGHRYIPDALQAGAAAVLAETAPPADLADSVVWLHVPDSRLALALLASLFHGHPWRDMALAGVTGTNGKTTTAFLIHHIMKTVWHRAGLLGTVVVDDGETTVPARHTTPGPVELQGLLCTMRDHGCRGV
nr:Mur ligase domain-containing protein [Akkermansiaceae bacterium]